MLESSTLTLSGNDNFVVDGLVGDLNANPTSAAPLTTLTGSLEITTGDAGDDTIDITTGAGSTTIDGNSAAASGSALDTVTVHAAAMLESSTLTLSGNDNFVVDGLVGDLNANPTSAAPLTTLTGSLEITTGDAADDTIDITTGAGNTTIDGNSVAASGSALDTVTVHAAAMLESSTLTLSGNDNFVVDGLVGDLNANPTSAAPLTTLTGSLEITTGDAGDDTIDITTGAGNTTIDGNSVAATGSALDTVTVHAAAMLESSTLTLSGNDNFVVDGLVGDLNANPTSAAPLTTLSGSLEITTGDAADDTIDITTGAGNTTIDGNSVAASGSALDTVTVHAAAMLESSTLTLSGNDNFVVDGLVGDLNANPTSAAPLTTLTGSLEITTGDAGDDTIDITTGAGQHHDLRQQRRATAARWIPSRCTPAR